MNLINNVIPALCPSHGKCDCGPDSFHCYYMLAVNGTHRIIKTGINHFVVDSSFDFARINVAHGLVEKVIHRNGGTVFEAGCDFSPELVGELTVFFALLRVRIKTYRTFFAVVGSIALIAYRSVHIENNIELTLRAFFNNPFKA